MIKQRNPVTAALVGAATVAVLISGCSKQATPQVATAKSGPAATASTAPAADAALKFVACMRQKGIPMQDPDPVTGEIRPQGDAKTLSNFATVYQACRPLLPNGGQRPPVTFSPQVLDTMRRFAQCMRDQGIPSYPDPGPDGWGQADSIPTGPKVDAANVKCEPIMGISPSAGASGVG